MAEESWPYSQIETHANDAADRLTSQYAVAEKLQGLLSLWGERIQGIEDAAWSLLTERWLDGAEGQQLDELGELVGEPRLGRTDETYREKIQIRIILNWGSGDPESVILATNSIWGDRAKFGERYPAGVQITLSETPATLAQLQRLVSATPAGVFVTIAQNVNAENAISYASAGCYGLETTVRPVLPLEVFESSLGLRHASAGCYGLETTVRPVLPLESVDSLGMHYASGWQSSSINEIFPEE